MTISNQINLLRHSTNTCTLGGNRVKIYGHFWVVFGVYCLWVTAATGQINSSYKDSIKSWASIIDTLLTKDDHLQSDLMGSKIPLDSLHLKYDHLQDDLSTSIIHYNQLFCGGGTAYFYEANRKNVVKIFYDSNCGDYWVEKNIYYKDGKIFLAKIYITGKKLKGAFQWEEYYRDNKLIHATKKIENIVKDILPFDSIKEGYKLLHDFKPEE